MRLKGVNPLEQHVEKIVVAVVGAAVLGIVTWQVVGPKGTVKVGPNDVPLGDAYTQIEKKALEVQGKIRATPTPPADKLQPSPLASFESRYRNEVAPRKTLVWDGGRAGRQGLADQEGPGPGNVLDMAAVTVPPTGDPIANVHMATIHPAVLADSPDLKKYLPEAMPFDKAGVSVEAKFDGAALAKVLEADPDGAGPLGQLPRFWWDPLVQIVGVELQRQELRPDGSWGDTVIVPPIPGRLDMLTEIKKGVSDLNKLREFAKLAGEAAEQIRRPRYLDLLLGDDWVPPSEVKIVAVTENRLVIDRKLAEIKLLERDIKRWEDTLQRPPGGGGGGGTGGGRSGGGGGGGGKGVGGGGGGGGGGSGGARVPEQNEAQKRLLTDRIERAKRDLDTKVEELRQLGYDRDGNRIPEAPDTSAQTTAATDPPLFADAAVRLWAHDITAERGRTYRYRLAVVFTNPLFGRAAGMKPEQADLAKEPIVRSQDSAWTAPVRVPDETYYFIINARDGATGGPLAGTQASAELFTFGWGYWRRGTISLEPGDPISGIVNIPELDKVLNLGALPEGAQSPDGHDPNREIGGGRRVVPDIQPGNPAPGEVKIDPGAKIPLKAVPVSRDAYLLDVAAIPALVQNRGVGGVTTGGPQFEAILRDSNGVIVTRTPEQDRSDPEYLRVTSSAQRGEEMVKPKPPPKPRDNMPGRDEGPGQAPGRIGGGKGAGGGG